MQKQHPQYRELYRGKHIWSLDQAEEDCLSQGKINKKGELWPQLHHKMKSCMGWVYEASKNSLARKKGYFDLLGVDFLVGDDLQVYLLEINTNPAIWFDSSDTLKKMVPELISETFDAVSGAATETETREESEKKEDVAK